MAPKRKRAQNNDAAADVAETIQPSSRDASGEDTADPILSEVRTKKEASTSREEMQAPSKRTRAGSKASTLTPKISTDGGSVDEEEMEVDEEGADGDEAEKKEKKKVGTGKGENGEAGTMRMDAPPKAGLVDPVGFKTNPPPEGRSVRVYADGVFDLFHLGHMRALQQAKTAFPDTTLIVGVTGNSETHRRKGLTVLSAAERAESVRHCKWVDEVIEDCPWIVTPEFLAEHSIDYVAHDDLPYGADEGDDIYTPIKREGKFLVTQRTEGVSTTGIITKIVRDYESYIARQLQRGQSRKELNISWIKKNELDIKRHVQEIRESIKQNWSTTGQELGKEFRQFWVPGLSRPGSPAVGSSVNINDDGRGSVRGRKRKSDFLTSPVTPAQEGRDARSPGAWSRFSVGTGRGDRDFVAGYAMGLLGSVKGWMQRNRRNLSDANPERDADLLSPHSSGSEGEDNNVAGKNGNGSVGKGASSLVDQLEASVAEAEEEEKQGSRGRKARRVEA
ncbi:choline-phosphate cytidylyltransferase [Elsinoe australis]|uniref:choline-phosphate cytidylyltransferase n=1 Tax=Elsinoe australis TaxID=40998 RepID=A0A4V6DT05_9PEZI|nr:choline-phosphate cytidylyltransferase [Elsinoe australis]